MTGPSSEHLQEGIYHGSTQRAPPAYRLLLLNVVAGASRTQLRQGLSQIHAMLADLRQGFVSELDGASPSRIAHSRDQYGELQVLLGFGRRLFDAACHDPALTDEPRPDYLAYLAERGPFPALRWSEDPKVVRPWEAVR